MALERCLTQSDATLFLDYTVGYVNLGVADGQEVTERRCPNLVAYLHGLLGLELLPHSRWDKDKTRLKAYADLLREMADLLENRK